MIEPTIPPPEWTKYLNQLYYDPKEPGSFQSFNKLHQTVKKEGRHNLGPKRLQRWLQNQEPYSRNRLFLPNRIKRSRVFVGGLYDQFDADLADYQYLKDENDGYTFLLIVIDVFSRYLWVEPLKAKSNKEVLPALEHIFRQGHIPRRLRTDQGKEFTANIMKKFYKHYNVTFFVSMNEVKANYAERAIKTIKSKLARYMNYHKTGRYIDVLQDMVTSYNSTFHKGIQMSPKEVSGENESAVWWLQYTPQHTYNPNYTLPKFKFKIGDYVRIPHLNFVFGREYRARWTKEIFIIIDSFRRDGINLYKVDDQKSETILGTFYEEELQKVLPNQNNQWSVEQIVKERGQGENHEAQVKFKGWPPFYNRWIPYHHAQRDISLSKTQT